jgi:hypothetical protein
VTQRPSDESAETQRLRAPRAETHAWPSGAVEGAVVPLPDPSAAQIAVGARRAAVTLASGSVLQLPLIRDGALSGAAVPVVLPSNADSTPLGAAFWSDILGFTPAHSPDSFAIVDKDGSVFPITGPTPPFPTNAPCWVAKGPGSAWYTGNSPGHAISIFFSDSRGGVFYKLVPLAGAPAAGLFSYLRNSRSVARGQLYTAVNVICCLGCYGRRFI